MPEWVPEENTLNYTGIYDGGLQEGWHFTSKSSNVSILEVPQAGRDNSTAVCFTMPTSEVRVLVWSVLDACLTKTDGVPYQAVHSAYMRSGAHCHSQENGCTLLTEDCNMYI